MSARILVVDDEPDICTTVQSILVDEGFEVLIATNGNDAQQHLDHNPVDLVLLDIWMQPQNGIDLLRQWKQQQLAEVPVVMMSGHGTVESAVQATRLGAHSFVEKPLTISKLLKVIDGCLERPQKQANRLPYVRAIVGSSNAIVTLRKDIEAAAQQQYVLIVGQAGSGRHFVAHNIHQQSAHKHAPFYSGETIGPEANNGSVLLHSNDLKQRDLQKLHQNLMLIVSIDSDTRDTLAKNFISTFKPFVVNVPNLDDYRDDIPDIIRASVDWFTQKSSHLPWRQFSIAAQNHIRQMPLANLRELDNLVLNLLMSGSEEVTLNDVQNADIADTSLQKAMLDLLNKPFREAREMFEKIYFEHILDDADGSIMRVAQKTGMDRTHLYRKLRALGISYKK